MSGSENDLLLYTKALTQRGSKEMRFDRRARLIGDRKRNQADGHLRFGVSAFPERWSGVK